MALFNLFTSLQKADNVGGIGAPFALKQCFNLALDGRFTNEQPNQEVED